MTIAQNCKFWNLGWEYLHSNFYNSNIFKFIFQVAHEKAKKLEGKKSRDDKDHVMEMLFALFEKHQYYKINDLVKATKQPVPYLKQILNEICDYVRVHHKFSRIL